MEEKSVCNDPTVGGSVKGVDSFHDRARAFARYVNIQGAVKRVLLSVLYH